MDRIAIAGVSIHGTDVSGLERLRRPAPGAENAFLRDLSDALGASELVFLATCNRVEVVYAREEGEQPDARDLAVITGFLAKGAPVDPSGNGAARTGGDVGAETPRQTDTPEPPTFLLRTGRDAARHLFRVSASLDSLMLGEDQIIAQVRSAYGRSADIGLVGPLLGPLFHHALAVGKRARSETDLARHPVSIVNLAIHALTERVDPGRVAVAVIGAGEMGRLVARALHAADVHPACIVNRTPAAARLIAEDCRSTAVALDAFRAGAHPVDVIVSATSAPGVVLDADDLRRLAGVAPAGAGLLGLDLAVPRDLARADGPGIEIVDIDALRSIADENRALRAKAAAAAEQLVRSKVDTYARRFREDVAAPVVCELRQSTEELLSKELQGLLSGRLAHLADADRRAVERWARSTFGRLMHLPVTALKRMAVEIVGDEPVDGDAPVDLDPLHPTPDDDS